MKRSIFLAITLGVALLGVTAIALAQTPSVPNLINFQGRLTDNVGNPVADGAHTVDFYIFPVRTGGVSVWSESQTPTTTGGLFTTQLGSVNPLPQTLFKDYDSLFLEIVADAQLISPRTLLSSTPSARVADNLEVSSQSTPGAVAFETDPFQHRLSMFGFDGPENFRLWGNNYGEILLFDSDVSNDLNVVLSSPPSGGNLNLYGNSFIGLDASSFGDGSAFLPTDAVNSGEILDEPGVSNSEGFGSSLVVYFPTNVLDSVDIAIPASGYVEVTCAGIIAVNHTNGGFSEVNVNSGKTSGTQEIVPGVQAAVPPASAPTGIYYYPCTSTRLYAEAAGTHRYYFHANAFSAGSSIIYTRIWAKYYPTLYGTVVLAKEGIGSVGGRVSTVESGRSQPISGAELTTISMADHNARLEAERAKQMAELEARIKKLEGQAAGQLPGQGAGTPRKER